MLTIQSIPLNEIPAYYRGYVNELNDSDFLDCLRTGLINTNDFLTSLPYDKWDYAYAPSKWTIKEVLMHLMDGERIFCYRALRFSRNDATELPGFDENLYVPNYEATSRNTDSLIEEYRAVRNATISLFENFTSTMLARTGTANGNFISVRALGAVIAGHEMHHLKVIRERYLI